MRNLNLLIVAAVAISTLVAAQTKELWTSMNQGIQVQCGNPAVSQTPISFVGFVDECDNQAKAPYEPTNSAAQLDLVIDPRNANDLLWDTARYKRYGTYLPGTHMDWEHAAGFNQLWTRVFYANGDEESFGHMRYMVSNDGVNWIPATNIARTPHVCTMGTGCWYKMKEETIILDATYRFARAIWPVPCQGEIDDTSSRSCVSLPPSGLEEDKDIYYAPQLGEIILSSNEDLSNRPGPPENLQVASNGDGTVTVEWRAPANSGSSPVQQYTIYYHTDYPLVAVDPNYQPPYVALSRNVGYTNSVVLTNIPAGRTLIVRVAGSNQFGRGRSSLNRWVSTTGVFSGNAVTCPAGSYQPGEEPPTAAPITQKDGATVNFKGPITVIRGDPNNCQNVLPFDLIVSIAILVIVGIVFN